MPVEWETEIGAIGQDRFHAVDRKVMGHAFAIHNELGRIHWINVDHHTIALRTLRR